MHMEGDMWTYSCTSATDIHLLISEGCGDHVTDIH